MKEPKFYVGTDIHKKLTAYAVRDANGTVVLEGKCASNGQDLHTALEPYLFSCVIGMEPNIEVYPVYDFFRGKGFDIRVANTVQMRTLVAKSDKLDALRLSDMLRLGSFPCAFIPEGKLRQLKSIINVRHSVLEECTRTQRQIINLVRKHGLVMPSGDSFTKRWQKALQEHIGLGRGGLELRHSYDLYIYIAGKLEQLTSEVVSFTKANYPKEFEALSSKKGIGEKLAAYFISEICPVSRFKSNKSLRRYAGVIPCSEVSADKTYSTRLPKTTSRGRLRWALVQSAHCMTQHDENIKAYYKKKKKQKRCASKAIMAVASSISDKVYKTLIECS